MKVFDRCFCNVPKSLSACKPYIEDEVIRMFLLDSTKIKFVIIAETLLITLLIGVLAQKAHFYVYPIVDYQLLAFFIVIIALLIVQFYFIVSGFLVFQSTGIFNTINNQPKALLTDEKQACLDDLMKNLKTLCHQVGLKITTAEE